MHSSESYFSTLSLELKAKRDFIVAVFKRVGMQVVVPQGTYFIMVDWSQLGKCQRNINRIILLQFICFSPPLSDVKIDLSQEQDQQKDFRFTKWMIKNIGFAAIPPSVFYSEEHESEIENYIRCCFFKEDDKLQKADRILTNWVKK